MKEKNRILRLAIFGSTDWNNTKKIQETLDGLEGHSEINIAFKQSGCGRLVNMYADKFKIPISFFEMPSEADIGSRDEQSVFTELVDKILSGRDLAIVFKKAPTQAINLFVAESKRLGIPLIILSP